MYVYKPIYLLNIFGNRHFLYDSNVLYIYAKNIELKIELKKGKFIYFKLRHIHTHTSTGRAKLKPFEIPFEKKTDYLFHFWCKTQSNDFWFLLIIHICS